MKSIEEKINNMINTPYSIDGVEYDKELERGLCWNFCCDIFRMFDVTLSDSPHQCLTKSEKIQIPCIVLFNIGEDWHAGVVWPDGLHFLHVKWEEPLQNEQNKKGCYMIRKERLTRWPWLNLLEGFYINAS